MPSILVLLLINNNVETLISLSGTECTNPIKLNSIRVLSIGIDSDISFNIIIWNLI